jgi:hypothetical protein
MIGATKKKLGVRSETLRVLSSVALDQVVGGAADPQVPKTALPAQAQVGGRLSDILKPSGQCIISCFCTNPTPE